MMTPENRLRIDAGIVINAVLTLSKNVKAKIHIIAVYIIRWILPVSLGLDKLQPNITGMTGKTHGASTDSTHATKEIRTIIMMV
jgi:hypothetical protein